MSKKKEQKKYRKKNWSNIEDVDNYLNAVLSGEKKASKEIIQQCSIIAEEFESKSIEVNTYLYDKYIKIGFLFHKEIFDWQRFATAICLCTFYKGTKRARWNKVLFEIGRGNGKDGVIAWWSACLTSVYHGVEHYDIDIIANNYDQSTRPLIDIKDMAEAKDKKSFYEKIGDSVVSHKTKSNINARSSEASMQDGLRSGAVIFNEVHQFENYKKLNVMITGLGKIDDPRQFFFTTNGEVRGGVLDDMLDTANDVLNKVADDKRTLYFIYKLDNKEEVHSEENWLKANPSLPYRETLYDQIKDEYDTWKRNPDNMPAFLQKRMNLPEMPSDQEVVPWEVILKTNQDYDFNKLHGMNCVLGIDLSKTTDWTAFNLLFYDADIDKYICINHAFICGKNKDLPGIKAPYQDWCRDGLATIIDEKEVDPEYVVSYIMQFAEENEYNIIHAVIDDFKKGILLGILEKYNFSKDTDSLTITRPSNIAPTVPIIERTFINEKFVWGDNPMLRWATNNTKVIPWHNTKTTGNNDLGNQLYGKINKRFRKTDPFMALVHSMVRYDLLTEEYIDDDDVLTNRGF